MSGTITTSTGLISGINTSSIIDQLIAIDAQPVTLLQNRITANQAIQSAYTDLQTRLSSLLTDVGSLVKPSTFQSASAASSNTNILGVTAKPTASPGTYTFTVARTVSTQSAISSGYSSTSAALGISGNITVGLGGGKLTSSANLADLNGGNGVSRGSFRITDASGGSTSVDISSAVSLDDVVTAINSADNIQVKASIGKNGLVLQDTSGGPGTLKVANVGKSTTATDLGILGTAAGTTLAGTSLNTVGRNSTLASLNDGLGVRTAGTGKSDLKIDLGDGTSVNVSLAGQTTLGGALDAINNASGGKFTAALGADGKSLQITNNSGPASSIAVSALNGSSAAADLGIAGSGTGTLAGADVKATLGSVLTKNLEGGSGLSDGQISLTDRAGNTGTVLISGQSSLSDVIDQINGAGTNLVASLNSAGTGIQIADSVGGSGNIDIASLRGATASQLGIEGSFGAGTPVVQGASLSRQYVNENTALADLNGGKGISAGKFTITTAAGKTATVDTTAAASLGDLISAINGAAGLNVTASVNSTGNGLLLTDNSGGAGSLSVKDVSGTAAADLNISGTAAAGSNAIDGAYSRTVSIAATDSLANIVAKLNKAGAGVSASVLNDGSPSNGNRLSITAANSGLDGQFTFDAGTTGLSLNSLTDAQNAAVFLGSPTSSVPVLLNSSSNTISNVVNGLTINLVSASKSPVTVNITQSSDAAVTAIQSFVTDFNSLSTQIATETKFSTDATQKGILLGDSTTQSVTDTLYQALNANIAGAGSFTKFADLGLTVTDGGQLNFDTDAFAAAYQKDPSSLQRVFTAFNTTSTTTTTDKTTKAVTTSTLTTAFGTDPSGATSGTDASGNAYTKTTTLQGFGIAYQLQNAINKLIDPVDGTIIKQSATLDASNTQFNDRITDLNTLLDAKRTRLETQFANMESVLAGLQTQQTALSSLTSSSSSSSSK